MVVVHGIRTYKSVMQSHETIHIKMIHRFNNHINSVRYHATYIGNMFFRAQFIRNNDSKELRLIDLVDSFPINV